MRKTTVNFYRRQFRMVQASRPEPDSPTLDEAEELVGSLPVGSYTLRDIATQFPDRLRAAMVLAGERARPRRQVSFHFAHGSGSINRSTRRRDDGLPLISTVPAGDITFTVSDDRPVQVSIKAAGSTD